MQCLSDANCGTGMACDTATNRCVVACTADAQCAGGGQNGGGGGGGGGGGTPYCNTAASHCVECLTTANCMAGQAGVCNPATFACVECLSNADCRGATCDVATHTCN